MIRSRSAIISLVLLLTVACTRLPTSHAVVAQTTLPTITPGPRLTVQPTQTLTPRVVILADNMAGADDLALAPDGSIYISDVQDGTISVLHPDGKHTLVVSGLREPEGMVVLSNGDLIIAEQAKNRLLRYHIDTRQMTTFLTLANQTGQAGVDGIVLDTHDPHAVTLIIPDSPNGRVLRVGLDGKVQAVVGRGFVRPTGAWIERDGSMLIADEFGNTIKRIQPDGKTTLVAKASMPDDVIADQAGNIFLNSLAAGAIYEIAAGSNQAKLLVGGLIDPQGILFDASGNLLVTDPGHRRLLKISMTQ